MMAVKRHYSRVKVEMAEMSPLSLANMQQPLVVIPMARWDRITEKAMRFGLLMSQEIKVVHVHSEDDGDTGLDDVWQDKIVEPIQREGMVVPELVMIQSELPAHHQSIDGYIIELEKANPGRKVAVLLPELVVRHWWEECAAQPAGATAEAVAAAEGQPTDRGGEYSVVSVR